MDWQIDMIDMQTLHQSLVSLSEQCEAQEENYLHAEKSFLLFQHSFIKLLSLVSVVAYSIAVMESLNCSVEMQTFEDSMLAL